MTDDEKGRLLGRRATRPDPHTPEQRRRNMSRIRSRNTRPELLLRKALHAVGLRYRLHDKKLPGTPDIVLSGRRAIIQVHGCSWQGQGCPMSVTPATNTEFWIEKIGRNRQRNLAAEAALVNAGWRVLVVWECALTGRARRPVGEVVEMVQGWFAASAATDEISGRWHHR